MKNKDCKGRFVFAFVVFCFFCLSPVIAGIPDLDGIMKDIFKEQIAKEQPSTSGFVSEIFENFDLDKETDEVMERITAESEFEEYIKSREEALPAEQRAVLEKTDRFPWILEFVSTRDDVKPEIKAWLRMTYVIREGSLSEMIESYQELEKLRPDDFLPKFLTIFRAQLPDEPIPTATEKGELIDILLDAIRVAKTPKEIGFIAFSAGGAVGQFADEDSESAERIWESVRDLEIPESSDKESKGLLTIGKLFTAMGVKEWLAASVIARDDMRALEPVLLMLAGKKEQAYERNKALRNDPTLTGKERSGFEKFEPFILMGTEHFDELRMVILEKRRSPTLTTEQREWLDFIERLNNQTDELARP